MAEESNTLTGILGATEEDGVASLRAAQGQLVKSDALTTSLNNSSSGSLGESEGGNGKLGNFQQARVISDSSDNNSDFAILSFHVSRKS